MTLRDKTAKKATTKSTKAPKIKDKYQPLLEALKSSKQFLSEFRKPLISTFKNASKTISRIVFDEPLERITISDKINFLASVFLSEQTLPGYSTLDPDHVDQISSFIKNIERYVDDSSQKRPLNFLMLASPGAGKSHFIKCVASRLEPRNVRAITFNMTSMQMNEDLIPPLDAARNLKVEDRLPLVFLDEFDNSPDNFGLLLPFLWDGGLNLGQRDLRLGKVIIVMAGSDPNLPETMNHARSMRSQIPLSQEHDPKLIDLFSRINGGVLSIPPFNDDAGKINRGADKVCIAIKLLKNRFGRKLGLVPLALLRFIAMVHFRYDVRGIAHLIDLIPYEDNIQQLSLEKLSLPLDSAHDLKESSLAYHLLHEDQALGIIKVWEESKQHKLYLPIQAPDVVWNFLRYAEVPDEYLLHYIASMMPDILR